MSRLLAALLALAVAAAPAWAQPQRESVTILFFAEAPDIEPLGGGGDLARIATVIARERARRAHTIVAHGGNALSPSFASAVDQGAHMVRLLNRMLIDVAVANYHEFDFGPDNAIARFAEMEYPVLGANVRDGPMLLPGLRPSTIVAAGAFRIGFVGAVTQEAPTISSPGRVTFAPFVAAVRTEVAALRAQGVDLVVLLSAGRGAEIDAGFEAGADVVLATAGSRAALLRYDGRRALAQVGLDGAAMVAIDLDLARIHRDVGAELQGITGLGDIDAAPQRIETVIEWHPVLRVIDTRAAEPDQLIEIVTQIELDQASQPLGEQIAQVAGPLPRRPAALRTGEGAIGSLVADLMRAAGRADAAIVNAGGLRGDTDLEPGAPMRVRDVVETLPFPNRLVVLSLTGAQLRAALEHGLAALPALSPRFLQISGLAVRFDPARPAGRRVVSATIGGRPLAPTRRYRVATNDFLARGGDGYDMLAAAPRVSRDGEEPLLRDLVVERLRALGRVEPPAPGRLAPVGARR